MAGQLGKLHYSTVRNANEPSVSPASRASFAIAAAAYFDRATLEDCFCASVTQNSCNLFHKRLLTIANDQAVEDWHGNIGDNCQEGESDH